VQAEAGRRLLLARSADASVNGGLPAPDLLFSFSLNNSNGSIYLGTSEALDSVGWAASTPGVAQNLDGRGEDPALNDQGFYWCPAVQAYGLGDLGTPGAANSECDLPVSECTDGGNIRPKVPPVLGDLVITELMADPYAVSDADGEWFEVVVLRAVDLAGLQGGRDTLTAELVPEGPCLRVAAGTRVLFARNADAAQNGGLPAPTGLFSFNLLNAGGALSVGVPGQVLDRVDYPAQLPGVARSLDPDSTSAAGNDPDSAWCPATQAYGAGDLGTPGAANPQCP
jgi:hypothetical protein